MALGLRRSSHSKEPSPAPGQSLDEEIQEVIGRNGYETMLLATLLATLAVWEWFRQYVPTPRPEFMTMVALAVIGWAGLKLHRGRDTVRRLQFGRDGERAVAEVLEQLRGRGYRIFHDVRGDGLHADHLLVGPQGLFVLEIQRPSVPTHGLATIRYDGESLAVRGEPLQREPIQHALALGRWVTDLINESSSRNCFVRPVLLYPGRFIEVTGRKASVWVLNPRMLAACINREPTRLSVEDVTLIALHLSRHVVASE